MLQQDRGEARPGWEGQLDLPVELPPSAIHQKDDGSSRYTRMCGWLLEKCLGKAQEEEVLRLADPEAHFIRTSQLGGRGSATPTWARSTPTLETWSWIHL